jgi:DNA-binding NtrC family response regulator
MGRLVEPPAAPRVLLIEDDEDVAFGVLAMLSASQRFQAHHAPTAAAARRALRGDHFDVVLADLSLPDGDGFDLLAEISSGYPGTGLLCLTGRNEATAAVQALRAGATDYLTKPASAAQILQALDVIINLHGTTFAPDSADGPVGEAPLWRRAMALLAAAARGPRTTVLVTGEPGVGKEEAAALLHRLSGRRAGPFIAVNASCLSPALIESELFGHEVGAFTGAQRQRRGLFEQAHGGTLFLDEIGEMPLALQAKLLRVIEGHPFCRVGGERPVTADVRLVCATNRDLGARVRSGDFRADLHERLRVFEVPLPPLRERPGDIPRLARHFITRLAPQLGLGPTRFSSQALEHLESHSFPGNVRELKNLLERALLLADGGTIERHHLGLNAAPTPTQAPSTTPAKTVGTTPVQPASVASTRAADTASGRAADTLELVIRTHILRIYEQSGQNVTRTAEALGMSRLAVRKRLQSYGLRARLAEGDERRSEDDR